MRVSFLTLFFWSTVRGWWDRKWMVLLNVLSIALGAAVFLAIQIANGSANRAFSAGVDLVAGKADLEVRGNLDEKLWPVLAGQSGIDAVTALVQGVVTLPNHPGEFLQVTGVDLFTSGPFQVFKLDQRGLNGGFESWLVEAGGVVLHPELARRLGLSVGDRLEVLANSQRRELWIKGVLDPKDSPLTGQSRFAVMDLGWAQELFGRAGSLDALELRVTEPARAEEISEGLKKVLPLDVEVGAPRQRSFQMQKMLAAFELNLTALSMVSLLVGVFLIFSTVSASVTRRRGEIGILRALGASAFQVRFLFLGEAFLYGAFGCGLGAIFGVWLARSLVSEVGRTISSLYVLVSVERMELAPVYFVTAAVFGLGSVLAGAWMPAAEAGRVDPLAALNPGAMAMESEVKATGGWAMNLGLLLLAAGVSWATLRFGVAWMGFVAAFLVLAAFGLLAPAGTMVLGSVIARVAHAHVLGRMAAENLRRFVYRNGMTAGALGVAVAMMVALTIMIFSFRETVGAWVQRAIVADLFLAPASNEVVGLGPLVPASVLGWLRGRPEVEGVDTFLEKSARIFGQRGLVSVLDGVYRGNMSFEGGNEPAKMQEVLDGRAVAVTQSFARRHGVREGGRVEVDTPAGRRTFPVVGVYLDYSRDQGVVLMGRRTFAELWPEDGVHSVAVYLKREVDPAVFEELLRRECKEARELAVYSNRGLRGRIFAIFDQTFAVTHVLRGIAVLVALVGISLAVGILVMERSREIAMLRAIGASRLQVQGIFMGEAAMVAGVALGLGLASGTCLSIVLTQVVNPAFFGWSIALRFPWGSLALVPVWIVLAALAAAWIPVSRAVSNHVASGLRGD
jgi:putative ABC transport system permease protein